MITQEPQLAATIQELVRRQYDVMGSLPPQKSLRAIRRAHQRLTIRIVAARRHWPYDPELAMVAGYHAKNEYMLKHWDRIQAGYTPADGLLRYSESLFFRSLFVNPSDASALNGLASILILQHELRAAAFFNDCAIRIARAAGQRYEAAIADRETIRYHLHQKH
jgi:hypothetical protein